MPLHIIIQQERRTQPERMATPIIEQLHSLSYAPIPNNISDEQFVGVFEWDGVSEYVIVHKGNYAERSMEYLGWPRLTEAEYEATKEKGDIP